MNTIWTPYFNYGIRVILIAISCLISQCSDPPCPIIDYFFPVYYFVYKNNSGVDLTIRAFRNYNDTIGYWEIPNEGEIVITTSYTPLPLGLTLKDNEPATVVVRFNNDECLTYDNETERNNILFSENYDWKTENLRIEENAIEESFGKDVAKNCEYYRPEIRSTWIFTPEDLNDATPCEEL